MTRIPRNQATGLEILAVFAGLGVFIGILFLQIPERVGIPDTLYSGLPIVGIDGLLMFLIMSCIMPTWGVTVLEGLRLPRQAERYAVWASRYHPLHEQRGECAVRSAVMAQSRQDYPTALLRAETGLAATQHGLERPALGLYYAICLSIRASCFAKEGRLQEALEDYSRATRLNLQAPSFTAQYYAQASAILYSMGRFDDAILFAQQAIAAAGCPAEFLALAHRSAALALAEQERYMDAAAQSVLGIGIKPLSPSATLLMVDHFWLLTMSGKVDEATEHREWLETLMKNEKIARLLKPEYEEVWARVCMAHGRWTEAEALLRQSLQGTDGHAAQCYYLHEITLRRGDPAEAAEWRARLLAQFPQSFYAKRLAGEISAQSGSRV